MSKIYVKKIEESIYNLCKDINFNLGSDVVQGLTSGFDREASPLGKGILEDILKNAKLASEEGIPLCQDTGVVVVFMDIGQNVQLIGDNLEEGIQSAIRSAYSDGYLRKSVVADPLNRINTGDNTPGVIHYNIVPGDNVDITVAAKGFGSENMSRVKMLIPADGAEGVINFVLETVQLAGSNPCPPIIVGVGIGGTLEKAALLAKKALMRPLDDVHPKEYYAKMERDLLEQVNHLGIGPQGLGGTTTAIGVKIMEFPTHIAGLPVAVNINCHSSRHGHIVIKGEK